MKNKIFMKDNFNSEILGKAAFVLNTSSDWNAGDLAELPDECFVTAKVKADNILDIKKLQQCGFFLIDTNLTFEKKLDVCDNQLAKNVFQAQESDKAGIIDLAGVAFKYSRFFLDPLIHDDIARETRQKWVANYFNGLRGDMMLVAKSADRVVGFCQLLKREETAAIDLIAVAAEAQRQGVATDMMNSIKHFIPESGRIIVGTQAANIPAARAYENNKFRLINSTYIFHYHGAGNVN